MLQFFLEGVQREKKLSKSLTTLEIRHPRQRPKVLSQIFYTRIAVNSLILSQLQNLMYLSPSLPN